MTKLHFVSRVQSVVGIFLLFVGISPLAYIKSHNVLTTLSQGHWRRILLSPPLHSLKPIPIASCDMQEGFHSVHPDAAFHQHHHHQRHPHYHSSSYNSLTDAEITSHPPGAGLCSSNHSSCPPSPQQPCHKIQTPQKRRRSIEKDRQESEIRSLTKRPFLQEQPQQRLCNKVQQSCCDSTTCNSNPSDSVTAKDQNDLNRRIQNVYSRAYFRKQQEEKDAWLRKMQRLKKRVTYSNYHDEEGRKLRGCRHYVRNCKLKAECCGVFVTCRLCHDEDGKCPSTFERRETKEVLCMSCLHEQPIGKKCVKCGIDFGNYYCKVCKFFDSTPGKSIYHCDKCGICRLGKGLGIDNIHCDECNGCITKERYGKHKCLPKSLLGTCPICNEELFTSMKDTYTLKCGHWIHSECCDEYRKVHKNYTCPICHKSMYDLQEPFLKNYFREIDEWLNLHRMPSEYFDRRSLIYCYDCEKKSVAPYHFVFHKCANPLCLSYNTHAEHIFKQGDPLPPGDPFIASEYPPQPPSHPPPPPTDPPPPPPPPPSENGKGSCEEGHLEKTRSKVLEQSQTRGLRWWKS